MKPVFIHAACCSRATSKPAKGFYDLCLEIGRKTLGRIDLDRIASFYLASMDPSLFGVRGEFQASLAEGSGSLPEPIVPHPALTFPNEAMPTARNDTATLYFTTSWAQRELKSSTGDTGVSSGMADSAGGRDDGGYNTLEFCN